jgi:hypothetical protein
MKVILFPIPSAQILATEILLVGIPKPRLFCEVSRLTRPKGFSQGGNMSKPEMITDITVAPGVREVASEDGAVLLDVEQGICFSLNPVGLRIWELLKKRCSTDQIANALAQEFSVPRAQLLSDAVEFIEALEAKRLVRRPDQTATTRGWFTRILRRSKKTVSSPQE